MINEYFLVKDIHNYFKNKIDKDDTTVIDNDILTLNKEICAIIKNQPKVKVPESKWRKGNDGLFYCDRCNNGYKNQPTFMGKPMFDYCPVCGAKMTKEMGGLE